MTDNVEKRLEQQSLTGTPLLKPDEQQRYLGTFKERCVAVLPKEASQETYERVLLKRIKDYPGGQLYINGHLPEDKQYAYIHFATTHQINFTIVNAPRDLKNDMGVVYALTHPIALDSIDLTQQLPSFSEKKEEPKKEEKTKKSLWSKLFHD